MRRIIIALAIGIVMAIPAAAQAHVTLQPNTIEAGGFGRLDVRVPNEREDAATTKVEVKFPDGFIFVSTEPVTGWEAAVKREKLAKPIEVFGEKQTEQVSTVTFTATGDGVQPGQFQDFGLSVGVPDAPGEALEFPSIQTYDSGEVVRWVGPEDSDTPAPLVTLTAAEEEGAAPAATSDDEASSGSEDDGDSDTLAIIALIVGGLGLAFGAWATFRRPKAA